MSALGNGLAIYLLTGLALMSFMYLYARLVKGTKSSGEAMSWREGSACFLLVLLLWPLVFGMLVHEELFNRPQPAPVYRNWVATPNSLIEHLSLEIIEQRELYRDPFNAVPAVPFGHLHEAWQRFCQQLQEEDQLWSFRIDTGNDEGLDYGKRHGVVEGYALLRGGEICGEFFARMA
jgi:hypothetical protein